MQELHIYRLLWGFKMKNMTLNEFREIKQNLHKLYLAIFVRNCEILWDEYDEWQNKLLSNDLSVIPFIEWKGMYLYSKKGLDFSQTHANIDFTLLKGCKCQELNLHGCNVKGIETIFYNENTFDAEYIKNHPHYFPDNSLPTEIKELFYAKKLTLKDVIEYPTLGKYINEYSFKGNSSGFSHWLVETVGLPKALKFSEEYPHFVKEVIKNTDPIFQNQFVLKESFNKRNSYEKMKQFVYKEVIKSIKSNCFNEFLPLDAIPEEMTSYLPNTFVKKGELPEEVMKNYYAGKLSFNDIRKYGEILKTKDLELGMRSFYAMKAVNKAFGSVWNYIDKVSDEYDEVISRFFCEYPYMSKIEQMANRKPESIIKEAIAHGLYVNKKLNKTYSLDELYIFSKYMPLEDLFTDEYEVVGAFIKKYGFSNIVNFNRKHNQILEKISESYMTLLEMMARCNVIPEVELLITDENQLLDVFNQIIHQIRIEDYDWTTYISLKHSNELAKLFPKEFLDYDVLKNYLNDEEDFVKLVKGFNGNNNYIEYLLDFLYQNPSLASYFKDKKMVIDNYNEIFTLFYNQVGQNKFWDICAKYGKGITQILYYTLGTEKKFKEFLSLINQEDYEPYINKYLYKSFEKKKERYFDIRFLPESFKKEYPDEFIPEKSPKELQDRFYGAYSNALKRFYCEKITPEEIQEHPQWVPFLLNIDFEKYLDSLDIQVYYNNRLFNLYEALSLNFSKEEILNFCAQYGRFIDRKHFEIDCSLSKEKQYNQIITNIYHNIKNNVFTYSDQVLPLKFIQKHPELFLDDEAPADLKKVFYNITLTTPLTFKLLKENRDWLSYLRGKDILLSFKKSDMDSDSLEAFFRKYGEEKAIEIGMKNPSAVTKMLEDGNYECLFLWYDKYHFVPSYVVMTEFSFEESDKFVASGRKWSQLMKMDDYNLSDDAKASLLKASMCFGVFDNDIDGYNKIVQLFSGIPKKVSLEDWEKMINLTQQNEDQENLIKECYGKEDNAYSLKISPQQNQKRIQLLRKIMEEAHVSNILTPDKAHKIFGGFNMTYAPDFRDFILKNMETILSSDDFMAYMSSIQKQWPELKAYNSNRNLTLNLALLFVKSIDYKNIQVGNNKLATVSSMAGYNQESFEVLQQIYNYGKSRVFNSIPRISEKSEDFTYEVLRLDDPLAVAIGTLTDCCQELGDAAQTSMEHSMVDKNGRVFVIRDKKGNIVAQSWLWRNQNVLCFDNIEIPSKAFSRAKQEGIKKEDFADKIFALYKDAGEKMLAEDEKEYQKLLDEGKITVKQYEALKISKVTVGLGYNDIAKSLEKKALKDDSKVKRPLRFNAPVILTRGLYANDSKIQYVIAGKTDVISSNYGTLSIYPDEFMIYDNHNITLKEFLLLQKLALSTGDANICYNKQLPLKEEIISAVSSFYGLEPSLSKIIMNANFAIVYEERKDEIIIGNMLYNTSFYDEEGKIVDISKNVGMQIRMALGQINKEGKKMNIASLSPEKRKMYREVMALESEIDEERGMIRVRK